MILFQTDPDTAAFVETHLTTTTTKNSSQWLYMGWKNKQHKEGEGAGYFIKNSIKNSCTTEPDNITIIYRNTIDQAKIKRVRKLIYRCFIW